MPDGYVTQSRSVPATNLNNSYRTGNWSLRYFDDPVMDGNWDIYSTALATRQTTYSYRSGKRGPGVSPEEQSLGSTPSNLAGEFGFIKSLDKATGSDRNAWDTGHEFWTVKSEFMGGEFEWDDRGNPPRRRYAFYNGPRLLSYGGTDPLGRDIIPPPFGDWAYYATRAIEDTIPPKPAVSLAYQLSQVLTKSYAPSLRAFLETRQGGSFRGDYLSDNFINYEFGVKPFISDTQDLIAAVYDAKRIIESYKQTGSVQTRRKRVFPSIRSTEQYIQHGCGWLPPPGSYTTFNEYWQPYGYYGDGVDALVTIDKKIDISFSGAYIQYVPEDVNLNNLVARIDAVSNYFGVELTEKDVYDLVPWSWFVDWQYNLGAVIKNASSFADQSLVLKYGYLNVTSTYDITVESRNIPYGFDDQVMYWRNTRKERIRSTPYGFTSVPSDFTDIQWAILGALGLTKAWRVLH